MKKISLSDRLSAAFAKTKTTVIKRRRTLSASFNKRYCLAGIYGAVTGGGIGVAGIGMAAVSAIAIAPVVAVGVTTGCSVVGAVFCAKMLKATDRTTHFH
jgi:hypothetical protein